MSGHSKWATIKRAKEATDAKRSSEFSKLSRDITVAARVGGSGDLEFNPSLRLAVDKAKAANMPNDKIQKAIDKGTGAGNAGEQTFENTYEAYGPGGAALVIDTETDNTNRTLTDVKTIINRNGAKFASEGSVSWQFKEIGLIDIKIFEKVNAEELSLQLLDIDGISDLNIDKSNNMITMIVDKTKLNSINNTLNSNYKDQVKIESNEIIKDSDTKVHLSDEDYNKLESIIDSLKEISEVVNIWHNAEPNH